jgi:aspartate/methionine/tyrosine aminotransferase
MALVEPGDEVILPDPGFPTYAAMIGVAGGVPVPVPLLEERNFSFDLEVFDRLLSERTRMVILNSPGNPTGGVMPIEDLEHVAKRALEHDLWILSDEIYSRMVYDGREAPSIGSLDGMSERTIIVDGFSKTYAMTGWRLGYAIMPESLVERVELLFTHSYGCTAHFTQFAGIEAITGSQDPVVEMVATFEMRRDVLVEGLNTLSGVRCIKPQGAFYVFPNITATGLKSEAIADLILEQAGVALLPGTAFGEYGEGYLRLSYASSTEDLHQALTRMRPVLESLTQQGA